MADERTTEDRLAELREEHRQLDEQIAELATNPEFDQIEVQRLKKRKLQLKDEIAVLENAIIPDIIA
ncbi:MAG: YdcH family protein [Planctomycetes bacterium]|nr:YdcH family protein [Planctomycetota bacterium]